MQIYNYSSRSGEFLFASTADPSPLEPGKFLIPAFATEQLPPSAGSQEIAVFSNGAWTLQPDFRGQTFYRKTDGVAVVINAIGPVADELTNVARPSNLYIWADDAWAFSQDLALAAIRARRNSLLAVCDWTQMGDAALSVAQKAAWQSYRQALRDFSATCDPANPAWPQQPA